MTEFKYDFVFEKFRHGFLKGNYEAQKKCLIKLRTAFGPVLSEALLYLFLMHDLQPAIVRFIMRSLKSEDHQLFTQYSSYYHPFNIHKHNYTYNLRHKNVKLGILNASHTMSTRFKKISEQINQDPENLKRSVCQLALLIVDMWYEDVYWMKSEIYAPSGERVSNGAWRSEVFESFVAAFKDAREDLDMEIIDEIESRPWFLRKGLTMSHEQILTRQMARIGSSLHKTLLDHRH